MNLTTTRHMRWGTTGTLRMLLARVGHHITFIKIERASLPSFLKREKMSVSSLKGPHFTSKIQTPYKALRKNSPLSPKDVARKIQSKG